MAKYIMRLDDAAPKRDIEKWDRMEALLDQYEIRPLVGVIPDCEDPAMEHYGVDDRFWERVDAWRTKGWSIAMHGCNHVYSTACGGINPVNARSEFAGEPLVRQKEKISRGVAILREHGIEPRIFFAPSHTFDENTLTALLECSEIRTVSDTVANAPYFAQGITFVPQQSGRVRALPFSTVTFCYHPNMMEDAAFEELETFLAKNQRRFIPFPTEPSRRKKSLYDKLLEKLYMRRHK